MIDIQLIRERPEWIKEQLAKRNDSAPIDEIVALDERRREIIRKVEELRRRRNESSKQIGLWTGTLRKLQNDLRQAEAGQNVGQPLEALRAQIQALEANADQAKDETRALGEQISHFDDELRVVETELQEKLLWVPNIPHESVPFGPDESYNVAHEPQGAEKPRFDFEPRPHWELGPELGILDFERGVKLSGSRFYLLIGDGARLQRALIRFMLDTHVDQHGYTEVYPPFIVRSENFLAAGQLPWFFDNIYRDAEEDLMLLGTAEIALTNVHRGEILDEAQLPQKYVAYTPCFRREKMSAGRDVRGIKRGHQFDKVEMYQITRPEESFVALEEMLGHATAICRALALPYRIVDLAAGDLGHAMVKTHDIEIWAAGTGDWLEVSSASNATDFQARRANLRYRPSDGKGTQYVHTLNASGLALPRVMIGIIENYQQADGTVKVPEVLWPFMGGMEVIRQQNWLH